MEKIYLDILLLEFRRLDLLRVGLEKQQELHEGLESRVQKLEAISHQDLKQTDEIGSETVK